MNRPSDERHREAELEWLAFCYAAGELPGVEAAAVEERMAHDQALREAVSRAVALGGELASARPAAATVVVARDNRGEQSRSLKLRRIAWAAISLAASVVLLTGAYLAGRGSRTSPTSPKIVAGGAVTVSEIDAAAWLELRRGADSAVQLASELAQWEPDEIAEPATNQTPVVPGALIDLAMTGVGKGKHD